MTDENIRAFLEAIASVRAAYENGTFHYLAVRRADDFYLVQGRVFLNSEVIKDLPTNIFMSANIRVGSILLSKLADSVEDLIKQLLTGTIVIDGQKFIFLADPSMKPGFVNQYQPFHPEGIQDQYRLNVLTISGAHHAALDYPFRKQPSLDWEVMANDFPYGNLQELAYAYKLGVISDDKVTV